MGLVAGEQLQLPRMSLWGWTGHGGQRPWVLVTHSLSRLSVGVLRASWWVCNANTNMTILMIGMCAWMRIKWWNVAVSSLPRTYTSPLFWNALDFSALRMEYLPDQNRGTLAEDEPFPCSLFYHVAAAHFPQHIPQMPESGKWSPVPEPPWGPSTPSWRQSTALMSSLTLTAVKQFGL